MSRSDCITSGVTLLESLLEYVSGQVAADENESAFAVFTRLPGTLMVALDQHVYALNDKALIIVLHGDNAFHAQYIHAETLCDVLDPGHEPCRFHGSIGGE